MTTPDPTISITIRLPRSMLEALKAHKAETGAPVSEIIRRGIENILKKD